MTKRVSSKKVGGRVRVVALPKALYPILAAGAKHAGVSEQVALAVVVGLAYAVFERGLKKAKTKETFTA